MKNKRWKREAKRMKGICDSSMGKECGCSCEEQRRCKELFKWVVPCVLSIREIEKRCKKKIK